MGITSALYSGISGLNTNGQALTVIGNNLANTNTIAYKGSRTIFSDLLSSTVVGSGGTSQIGRGVGLSTVDNVFSQGTFETTTSGLDLAIEGSSFFIVADPTSGENYYTRAGSFKFDESGFLVNAEGFRVQGIPYDANGQLVGGNPADIYLDGEGLIQGKDTDELVLTTNLDSGSKTINYETNTVFNPADPDTYTETETIADAFGTGTSLELFYSKRNGSSWEVRYRATDASGNVTPADIAGQEPTILSGNPPSLADLKLSIDVGGTATDVTVTGTATLDKDAASLVYSTSKVPALQFDYTDSDTFTYSASTQIYDSLGNPHLLTSYFTKVGDNLWQARYTTTDADGNIIPADPNNQTPQMVYFGADGEMADANGEPLPGKYSYETAVIDWGNGADPSTINVTLDTTQFNSDSTVISQAQNGYAAGSLSGVVVDEAGNVVATYSNGENRYIAGLSLAKFLDPNALQMAGSNLFAATLESGAPRIGSPGAELGTIYSYSLEMSNVDTAAEMVDMITIQRGYQANSKIITTVDELLDEIINIKR